MKKIFRNMATDCNFIDWNVKATIEGGSHCGVYKSKDIRI